MPHASQKRNCRLGGPPPIGQGPLAQNHDNFSRSIKFYISHMATTPRQNFFDDRANQLSAQYWLDIDVTFNEITRQQRMITGGLIVHWPRSSLRYSILRGFGTVTNALSVGHERTTFDRFEVDVTGIVQTDQDIELPQLHRSAKMIWTDVDIHSPRLEIYVQIKMLRHLVELYVTKRIDAVIMSMKIATARHQIVDVAPHSELLPLLDEDGHLYFRRTECELLSVNASLASERARSRPSR